MRERKCRICGQLFMPKSPRQLDCNQPITKICIICKKKYIGKCSLNDLSKTCSAECQNKLASELRQQSYSKTTRTCDLCGQPFHPRSNTQRICDREHTRICEACGKEYKIDYKPSMRFADLRRTCSDECERKLHSINNGAKRPEVQEKMRQTCLEKYGVEHPMQVPEFRDKLFASYKEKTGFDHPSKNPQTRKGKNYRHSSLEQLIETTLINNKIKFEPEHMISDNSLSHSFDFYLPDYNILIDADGDYYHGYLDDSNGEQVSEDRDDARLLLVPNDYIFHVIVESDKINGINQLLDIIHKKDSNSFDYNQYMFEWCRSIDFPYPQYTKTRLNKDYQHLSEWNKPTYSRHVKLGMSSIRHFHKSMYDAKVGNNPSLKEAWFDDNILKRAIANRMLYVNNVDPAKILAGFYISKIVPKVSIFNPVLARYLTRKYLAQFNEVFDPFSGFSGRLLGVTSLNKHYIGQDLNETAVEESNKIIDFLQLNDKARVVTKNILDSFGQFECLLTCPPYGKKEIYAAETEFRTCDEWIDECLTRFNCKRYVFVVDTTTKYADMIKEELDNQSHLSKSKEYVIVIERKTND